MSRQVKEIPARSYLSTAAFHLNFFTYTTSMNRDTFTKSGDLSAVSGATSGTCPAGRVLRENGRKLYPGAHNISTVNGVATTFPPSTVMVGVFDNQSGLSGFIDVNAPIFVLYNGDRAGYLKDAVDPVGGLTDQSAPTLTNGSVQILRNLDVSGNTALSGTLTVTGTSALNGGASVGSSGTLITRIKKGTMQAAANLSAQGANTPVGGSQILVCPLSLTTSINDSLIVNQRDDIGGWVQTGSWIDASGNAYVKCLFQGCGAGGAGAITRPTFNYTLIQS